MGGGEGRCDPHLLSHQGAAQHLGCKRGRLVYAADVHAALQAVCELAEAAAASQDLRLDHHLEAAGWKRIGCMSDGSSLDLRPLALPLLLLIVSEAPRFCTPPNKPTSEPPPAPPTLPSASAIFWAAGATSSCLNTGIPGGTLIPYWLITWAPCTVHDRGRGGAGLALHWLAAGGWRRR